MTKIYKRRKLHGLESNPPCWAQIGDWRAALLSEVLDSAEAMKWKRVFLSGTLEQMTREYMREPLDKGWNIAGEFAFKHRTAVYENDRSRISVKLIGHRESWFPGCEDADTAASAWRALESEWKSTGLPLLSSPAATGKALLWESLPRDKDGNAIEFPALPDDLARLIRANSPQHRLEQFNNVAHLDWFKAGADMSKLTQYDGRWMYAAMCGLDRFPVGTPRRAEGFTPYAPGIYDVTMRVPKDWSHIGLLPMRGGNLNSGIFWEYPCKPGQAFRTWAFEPELTLALEGVKKFDLPAWEIMDFYDGYTFDKGRPLAGWSAKLIEMRAGFQDVVNSYGATPDTRAAYRFAAAAVRQILNHAIGSIHKNEYQRERFVSDDNYRLWRRENPHLAEGDEVLRVDGGYMVPCFVADNSPLSIFMPHWSSTLYSLARARVAEWALKCEPETLVKIHGDAIYSTIEQPELDKLDTQRIGQPRRK